MKRRYSNTRYSRPGERGTVKPYGTEVSPTGTVYYLSAATNERVTIWKPRVFWLHPTKGWRSQGERA